MAGRSLNARILRAAGRQREHGVAANGAAGAGPAYGMRGRLANSW
jgi:hypothetical protein